MDTVWRARWPDKHKYSASENMYFLLSCNSWFMGWMSHSEIERGELSVNKFVIVSQSSFTAELKSCCLKAHGNKKGAFLKSFYRKLWVPLFSEEIMPYCLDLVSELYPLNLAAEGAFPSTLCWSIKCLQVRLGNWQAHCLLSCSINLECDTISGTAWHIHFWATSLGR